MPEHYDGVNDWAQLALIPPPVVVVHLRIGVMVDADHVQAQVEVCDETTGELIAMESWPHVGLDRADRLIRESALKAITIALGYVPTFP